MFKMDGKEFASQEEWQMWLWLEEALMYDLVKNYIYQPVSLSLSPRQTIQVKKQLKTKTKMVDKFLLHPHSYQADFLIEVTDKFISLFNHGLTVYKPTADPNHGIEATVFCIDVKGAWGGINHSAREFSINQKWLFHEHGIFVNSVVPEKWFKRTWLPERLRTTLKSGKPSKSKKWIGCKTYKEQNDKTNKRRK